MNPSQQVSCPLCGKFGCEKQPSGGGGHYRFFCGNCREFRLSDLSPQQFSDDGWKLAAYAAHQNLRKRPPFFKSSQAAVGNEDPSGSVGLDTALAWFPNSLAERLDMALCNLHLRTQHLGEGIPVQFDPMAPLLLSKNGEEGQFTAQYMIDASLAKGKADSNSAFLTLTTAGFEKAIGLERGQQAHSSRQVFIAMSFEAGLNAAYKNGLKPGIEDAGFTARRADEVQHNEKICDIIVAEIRKSRFLVADFTNHRGGVYFEAGLMMGLGRPVIFTCRKDHLDQVHFDTRQYNHIEWDTPEELRAKLTHRIQATQA